MFSAEELDEPPQYVQDKREREIERIHCSEMEEEFLKESAMMMVGSSSMLGDTGHSGGESSSLLSQFGEVDTADSMTVHRPSKSMLVPQAYAPFFADRRNQPSSSSGRFLPPSPSSSFDIPPQHHSNREGATSDPPQSDPGPKQYFIQTDRNEAEESITTPTASGSTVPYATIAHEVQSWEQDRCRHLHSSRRRTIEESHHDPLLPPVTFSDEASFHLRDDGDDSMAPLGLGGRGSRSGSDVLDRNNNDAAVPSLPHAPPPPRSSSTDVDVDAICSMIESYTDMQSDPWKGHENERSPPQPPPVSSSPPNPAPIENEPSPPRAFKNTLDEIRSEIDKIKARPRTPVSRLAFSPLQGNKVFNPALVKQQGQQDATSTIRTSEDEGRMISLAERRAALAKALREVHGIASHRHSMRISKRPGGLSRLPTPVLPQGLWPSQQTGL